GGPGGATDPSRESSSNRLSMLLSEEMAWGDPAVILNLPGPGLGGPPVRFKGTPEQKKHFLGMFSKDTIKYAAYALTEPGAGSDAANLSTLCRKDGDHYVLNGAKFFITNGKKAEWTTVFATIDKSLGRAGHRCFVVEKGTPGFRVPKLEKKMGLRASETAEQVFEDCRVPVENLLGGEKYYEDAGKEGFKGAMKTFDATRPLVAIMAVGIARAAFEICRDWVKSHFALAQHTPRFRRVAEDLAWMEREIHAARLLCWRAAYLLDVRKPNAKESSMSKAYAGTMVQKVTAKAIEIMGPEGVLDNHMIEKLYRDQKVYDIFEGTGQIQRVVISRRLFEGYH
ncbi:acyl-CoA dehydrogenase family protein, partial [bacterium]|nr:acyl-CoA dehydrogenase family protein [bacterium]